MTWCVCASLVTFARPDIKTRKQLRWVLDAECSGYLRDYLRKGRPLFPGAAGTDALWLGNHGEALDIVGLSAIVRRRTLQWFGHACGPHATRKWLQSSAALRSPEAAFDAAEVAGHSVRVAIKHYRRADAIGAGQRHAATSSQEATSDRGYRRTGLRRHGGWLVDDPRALMAVTGLGGGPARCGIRYLPYPISTQPCRDTA